ncbi:MAG TPA: PAS domain S-box protein [Geobacteraceae bacterium]
MVHNNNPGVGKRGTGHGLAEGAVDPARIEGMLEESQLYLATILATVQVGILVIDAETHAIVDANPKAVEMIGAPRETIIGSVCHKFICPAETGMCPITDMGQRIDNAERTLLTAAGARIPIIKTVAAIMLHGRHHLVESFLDNSDRKRAEQSLQESEERYRDLLENANDLIQSVDPRGSFLYVNRAWKETMGYTDGEIATLKVFDILAPACRSHCLPLFQRVMSGETVPRMEIQFVTKDGRVIVLEGSVNCNFVDGRPVATRGIFRDITERKRAEIEREEWNRTLELKVEEKTRHLKEAQAKLIQSEKLATLSEVISGAAHELNNPLAGILGAIQLLRRSTLTKPIEPELMEEIDVLESIESAAGRCQKIVEDLIRFSMQSHCSFSRVDVNEVLTDTLEAMGGQFAQAGVAVTWHPDPALPGIEGDFVKLFEVFANILQNATNAMPDGGSVEVAAHVVTPPAAPPQVVISIRDTGCGIPPHQLGKIFDPFFTTKPVGKGPGLGLTVSYGVVKRHNGDIEVRSTTGKGTEVIVTLPVRQPEL